MYFEDRLLRRHLPFLLALLALLALWGVISLTGAALAASPRTEMININNYSFDPLGGEPALPTSLRAVPSESPSLYLVQFKGPVEQGWKDALTALGGRIYGYIPENAFIVRLDGASSRAARALPQVRWIGPYHPAYRISPEIGHTTFHDAARNQDPQRLLLVQVADNLFSTADAARGLGTVMETVDDPTLLEFVIHADPARIPDLARLPDVLWVQEREEGFILNNTTKWVVQSNVRPLVPIWDHGVFGEGQIIAQMDTGLDYNSCWFRDTNDAPPGPTNRKVIDYKTWGGIAYDGCNIGHGTHVAGTAVGDQSFVNAGVIQYNGMAYKAKIAFQDVGQDNASSCSTGSLNVPASLTASLTDAYNLGARVHTNSWGNTQRSYGGFCQNVDSFMWTHPDFLCCYANGNNGPGTGTVGSPASAKDCVSVGASAQDPNQGFIAGYSSRGPTADGRFKPTVDAPGGENPTYINSADNNPGNPPTPTCAVQGAPYFEGTSMATPAVAGCALLVRDYFAQGIYPSGVAGGSPLSASAALVKAMLVNSGQDMTMGGADQPNNNEGWGRVLLDDAMFFQGDTRELRAEDDAVGLATGEQASFQYEVDSSAEPLEVTLVWTDYPGAPNASPALVNNLDLTVTSPSSVTYLGNVYSGGQSNIGGSADNLNVEECARRNTPELGVWTITVTATNVPQGGHQPFALVTTGAFANWPPDAASVASLPAGSRVLLSPAQPNPSSGRTTLGFNLPQAGRARLSIHDAAGRRVATLADGTFSAGTHQFEWNGRGERGASVPAGVYFYRLEAEKTITNRKLTVVH